jgi:hypothetical protein
MSNKNLKDYWKRNLLYLSRFAQYLVSVLLWCGYHLERFFG